jgi:exodeoxyribonuclease VII small subunit
MTEKCVDDMSFEEAMKELEGLVKALEKGDMSLDESMSMYERAWALRGRCQSILDSCERKVEKIVEGAEGNCTEEFE